MSSKLRFDFPPEFIEERDALFSTIRELLAEETLSALEQARRMHLAWLQRYPDDYVALDAGEVLAMTEEAYHRSEALPEAQQADEKQPIFTK